MKEYSNKFGGEIYLSGASYNGDGDIEEFSYKGDHKLLKDFRKSIKDWLENKKISVFYTSITNSISLETYDELSSKQIQEFEKEFDVKFKGYSQTCNSNELAYKFAFA